MNEIKIESREDFNEGEFDKTTADTVDSEGNNLNKLGIGYPSGESNVDTTMPLYDNMFFQLRFDESVEGSGGTITDFSGNNVNAETVNGVDTGENGILGSNSFYFEGGTSDAPHVFVDEQDTANGASEVSISFWVKDQTDQDNQRSVYIRAVEDNLQWRITNRDGGDGLEFRVYDESENTDDVRVDNQNVPQDEWAHIVAVFDNGDIKLYINGESEGEATASFDTIGSGESGVSIGARTEGDRALEGFMDEIMVFDTALSEQEIRELYFSGHEDDNFEGEYTSKVYELSEEGFDIEQVGEVEITADIDEGASAEVTVEALDENDNVVDSDTIQVSDGTDTYEVSLPEEPKIRVVSSHEVSLE